VKKIRSIWSFIKPRKVGNILKPAKPPACPSGTWYSTLDLPLDRLFRCLVDSDLLALVISGSPSQNDLYNAWEAIYELFLDAMKDKDGLYKVRLLGRINLLDFRYKSIQLCLDFLRKAHAPSVEATLRNLVRVDGVLNPDDKKDYLMRLQAAQNRAQHILIDKETLDAEYAILKGKGQGNAITHDHCRNLTAQVSFFMKFRINPRDISTGEFASYYSMMRETNDLIRQQNKRHA
jgi:hypothetical protein